MFIEGIRAPKKYHLHLASQWQTQYTFWFLSLHTITTDQGSVFDNEEIKEFSKELGFKIIHSTPYAQANGQVESTNEVLKNIIEKMVDENPRVWHELLSDALWAHRTSKKTATGVTPYVLVYGNDAVLPMEINVRSLRVALQYDLLPEEYKEMMMAELENLDEVRIKVLENTIIHKKQVINAYNKKIRPKSFEEGEIVWKTILPLGIKDTSLGKWSPNWEGPYVIEKVLPKNVYHLTDFDGKSHPRNINGIYLKPFRPSIWS